MPPPGAGANYYILFGHSLHSTLQAPTCLYEAMSSQCTPYPGAPFLLYSPSPIIRYLEDNVLPLDDKLARQILLSSESYLIHQGVLYHILDTKTKDPRRHIEEICVCLVVPLELRYDVLTATHGDLSLGHYGNQRSYSTLRLKYYWKGMYRDCRNFFLSCEQCNTRKNPVSPTKAPLQPMRPARINEWWSMDIVHMPQTPRGNKYALTFTEYVLDMLRPFHYRTLKPVTLLIFL